MWDLGAPPGIGTAIPQDPCELEPSIQLDRDHLLIRNAAGETLSAYPFSDPRDEWVLAVRTALLDPGLNHLGQRTLREHLAGMSWAGVIGTVAECGRPIVNYRAVGSGDIISFSDRGIAETFDAYLADLQGAWTTSRDIERLGRAAWLENTRAAFEARDAIRYYDFPFDAETCHQGARYLELTTPQRFPISDDNVVDFTGYATQVQLTGEMQMPLSEVEALLVANRH